MIHKLKSSASEEAAAEKVQPPCVVENVSRQPAASRLSPVGSVRRFPPLWLRRSPSWHRSAQAIVRSSPFSSLCEGGGRREPRQRKKIFSRDQNQTRKPAHTASLVAHWGTARPDPFPCRRRKRHHGGRMRDPSGPFTNCHVMYWRTATPLGCGY